MKKLLFILLCTLCLFSCKNEDKAKEILAKAMIEYQNKNFDSSVELTNQILKIDSKNQDALFLKAKAHFFKKDFEEAKTVFQKLTDFQKENFDYKIWLLRAYYFDNDLVNGTKYLSELQKNSTEDWRLYYWQAQFAKLNNDFENYFLSLNNAELILKDTFQVYQEFAMIWTEFEMPEKYEKYNAILEALKK